MQRILFTIPNFDTAGSGKALLNIAFGLNKEKFESHILCQHTKGEFFDVVKNSGLPVHVFEYVSPARPFSKLFAGCWSVSKKFKQIKPDIIHSFHYSADYSEALAAKMAGIPWVFTKKSMSWFGPSIRAWKLRSSLAKKIIVQNTDMIEQFYPHSKKINLIPRGVDTKKFSPQPPDIYVSEMMHTPRGARIIICVANFVPVKGIEILLQSFSKLSSEFPGWYLWLVGDNENEYGKTLQSWVVENAMSDKIKFSGRQMDIRKFLDAAEIFVLPTLDEGRREGTPVAMLEAMANCKTVLGSAVPGIKDQLKNYEEHLFMPGSVGALTQKLHTYMSYSSEENKITGNKFMQLCREKFSIEKEIAAHEKFYENIHHSI